MQTICIKMFYKIQETDRHSCKDFAKTQPLLNAIHFNTMINATISFLNKENFSLVSFPGFMRFSLYFSDAYQWI